MVVQSIGRSLTQILPNLSGQKMNEFFDIVRPLVEFQFNSILSRLRLWMTFSLQIFNQIQQHLRADDQRVDRCAFENRGCSRYKVGNHLSPKLMLLLPLRRGGGRGGRWPEHDGWGGGQVSAHQGPDELHARLERGHVPLLAGHCQPGTTAGQSETISIILSIITISILTILIIIMMKIMNKRRLPASSSATSQCTTSPEISSSLQGPSVLIFSFWDNALKWI